MLPQNTVNQPHCDCFFGCLLKFIPEIQRRIENIKELKYLFFNNTRTEIKHLKMSFGCTLTTDDKMILSSIFRF